MQHGPNNTAFWICGSLLLLICAAKLPALIRRPHDQLLRAAVLLLFIGGWVFFLAAPDSIAMINRISGVPNFAAPLAYSALTGFAGASLLLIINWRPAPPRVTRRASRVCISAYALAIIAINALFWCGNASVEQLTLFDGYYAQTPFIREMIVLYLVAHAVGTLTTSVLCRRWSKQVDGSLRAGLLILVPAYLLHVVYDGIKLVAIGGIWAGYDWTFLIDQVAPHTAAPSALLVVTGFFLPLVGPRLAQTVADLRQLRVIAPLWKELRHVPTPGAVRSKLPWWTRPAVRLTGRKTAIYDAFRALAPYCSPGVRDAAFRAAKATGEDGENAAAIADTAMVLAASQGALSAQNEQGAEGASSLGHHDLAPLAQAVASPIVQQFREPRRSAESSDS
ncbi:MAB_1171c family putative transporter [Streptomyces ardesiacus]|uniref:MAB_1171c family putative transporter n=1 Tax=Streptomyces ardesiacus TaxID=285564 RepID=UPI0036B3F950